MAKGHNITQQVYTKKDTLEKIYKTLNTQKVQNVYDPCMGNGNWLEFEKEFNPDVVVYGNDIDKEEVVKAIKRLHNTDDVVEDNSPVVQKYKMITVFKVNGKNNICLFHADSFEFNVWGAKQELFTNYEKFIEIK